MVHVSGYVLKVELTLADGVGLGESWMTQGSDLYSIRVYIGYIEFEGPVVTRMEMLKSCT